MARSIRAFESENANLREELAILQASDKEKVIEYLRQENIDWEDKYRALAAENAKLRELVQGLWFAAQYLGMNPDGATGSSFARQICELGIEVDE